MGKAGRFVCIFIPMVLTIASLVFQIMAGLGGSNAKNSYLSNIYFLQANTSAAAANSFLNHRPASQYTDSLSKDSDGKIVLERFYTISLWNYCAGGGANTSASPLALGSTTAYEVDYCTGRQLHFAFDPAIVWGFNNTNKNGSFVNNNLQSLLDVYQQTSSKWISTLFIIAAVATGVEILIGIGGLFSRLGSLFTTISALIATAFVFAFATLSTVTYVGIAAAGNVALRDYGIDFRLGATMFAYVWLSVACSLTAGLFWAFSSCCCSGRSRAPAYPKGERAPYTYDRVDGPPHGPQYTVPMNNNPAGGRPTAYEPFRHGQ